MIFFIVAGGTGGHIYPGKSLFDELVARGHDVFFIGGERDQRFSVVKELGGKHLKIVAEPLSRKKVYKNLSGSYKNIKGLKRSLQLIETLKPDCCIGMGGFVTGAVLLAAKIKGIPYMICEQNGYAGLANRFFGRWAKKIVINFPKGADSFRKKDQDKVVVIGNPVREDFKKVSKTVARDYFGIKNKNLVVGIMGGSQGAYGINEAALTMTKKMKKVNFLWSSGAKNYDYLKKQVKGSHVSLFSFVEKMDYFLSACDLIISRSGATSLAEIANIGLPSILVPYPHATGNHQAVNADYFREAKAALVIPEQDSFDKILIQSVDDLMGNESELNKMANKAAKLYKKDIVFKMANLVEKIRKREEF